MSELKIYEQVNQTETLAQLAEVIYNLRDTDGMIQGRYRKFNAGKMANFCRNYRSSPLTVLTREYGIRQQAMYICLSENVRSMSEVINLQK